LHEPFNAVAARLRPRAAQRASGVALVLARVHSRGRRRVFATPMRACVEACRRGCARVSATSSRSG